MENTEFKYLNSHLPNGNSIYKITKQSFGVLNEKNTSDGNCITKSSDISMDEYPQITPRKRWEIFNRYYNDYEDCRGFFGYENRLFIVYATSNNILIDVFRDNNRVLTAVLKDEVDEEQRSIVLFNVADTQGNNIVDISYTKKILIFPDKKSIDFDELSALLPMDIINMPNIKYAVVNNSRLFGVDDNMVYASAFNDYANWELDYIGTSDMDDNLYDSGYDENHAWCSTAQSNTKASGNFTGITSFDGHVVCFKKDYMQEIYGSYNPFKVIDIYSDGAIDQRSIQVVGNQLIFCSSDYIKIYTGSEPKIISYPLKASKIKEAIAGTDGRKYYVYLKYGTYYTDSNDFSEKHFYVYDTFTNSWVEYDTDCDITGFAHNNNGMYMVRKDGYIIKMECDSFFGVEWSFDTDFILEGSIDIRHIHKLQILAEMGPESDMSVYLLSRGAFDDENYGIKENAYTKKLIATAKNEDTAVNYLKTIRIYPKNNTANYGFKLRFEGTGYVKLYNTEIFVRSGGALSVGSPKSK